MLKVPKAWTWEATGVIRRTGRVRVRRHDHRHGRRPGRSGTSDGIPALGAEADLVLDAVARMGRTDAGLDQLPDTGSLREDMIATILPQTTQEQELRSPRPASRPAAGHPDDVHLPRRAARTDHPRVQPGLARRRDHPGPAGRGTTRASRPGPPTHLAEKELP